MAERAKQEGAKRMMKEQAKSMMSNISCNAGRFGRGLYYAGIGSLFTVTNPKVFDIYKRMLPAVATVSVVITAVCLFLALIFLPITLLLLFLAPGFLVQLSLIISLWAHYIIKRMTPLSHSELFLANLDMIDQDVAEKLRANLKRETPSNWTQDLLGDLYNSKNYTFKTLCLMPFTFIPFLGIVLAFVFQTWFNAESLGWSYLSPFCCNIKKMSDEQHRQYFEKNYWPIMGLTVPFALLGSIPLLGPFVHGVGQGAMAHLFINDIMERSDVQQSS